MKYRGIFALAALVFCFACTPPQVQRPLDGAQPGTTASATSEAGIWRTGALRGAANALRRLGITERVAKPWQPQRTAGVAVTLPEAGYVIVATEGQGANLREAPNLSSRVITTIAEGTVVEVYGDTVTADGRQWRRIRGGNRDGWVVAPVVRRR